MRQGIAGALLFLLVGPPVAQAQVGTAFTYQGRLSDATAPANGSYDMEFRLFDALSGSAQVGLTVAKPGVTVSAGLFTVPLDFGGLAFSGNKRWLEIGVKPSSGSTYTVLTPRQELTPVPNAIYAGKAGDAATVSGLSCTNGQVLKWNGSVWTCGTDANSGGTVTSVTAGAGLTGGTITTTGTIAIDPSQVQTRLTGVCPAGEYLRGVNVDGTIVCGTFYELVSPKTTVDDPVNQVGEYISMAIGADGLPVISYRDVTANTLKVAKCMNAGCTGTSTITTIDDPASWGYYSSIAIGADGLPVISYWGDATTTLKVAKCVNVACTATSVSTVDAPAVNQVGAWTSIEIGTEGFPVISYRDNTAGTLKVAKCVNAACTGTSTITIVDDPASSVGTYTSIAIGADGFPVIAYRDETANTLKVAKCVNGACTGTSTITTVDAVPAYDISIAVGADGFPVISYWGASAGTLKVAKCMNAACTATSTITTVDAVPSTSVGGSTSIAIGSDTFPVISYQDVGAFSLKVAKCVNAACTGTSTITIVDDPENSVGAFTSIAIGADGFPTIAYRDQTAGTLKLVKCKNAACIP